jgi:hypothetical protein
VTEEIMLIKSGTLIEVDADQELVRIFGEDFLLE